MGLRRLSPWTRVLLLGLLLAPLAAVVWSLRPLLDLAFIDFSAPSPRGVRLHIEIRRAARNDDDGRFTEAGDIPARAVARLTPVIVVIEAHDHAGRVTQPDQPHIAVRGLLFQRRGATTLFPYDNDLELVEGRAVLTPDALPGYTDVARPADESAAAPPVAPIEKLLLDDAGVIAARGRWYGSVGAPPLWRGWALLPPLLAILLALLLRQVVVALGAAVWAGLVLVYHGDAATALLRMLDGSFLRAVTDRDHMSIIMFSMLLGGMVAIVTRAGGTHGIVALLARRARGPRSAQAATWGMGLLIFFDDYANTLLVGNTMRPYTDARRISREKLAFLVDATAAPVAGLALISTWIGFEVGQIDLGLKAAGLADQSAYALFVDSLPYRFYSILLLGFVFMVAVSGRDFGAMLKAERRARHQGLPARPGAQPLVDRGLTEMEVPDALPKRARNALIPVAVVVAVTLGGIIVTGMDGAAPDELRDAAHGGAWGEWLRLVFGAGDSYRSLLWGAAAGCLSAGLLAWTQRLLSLGEVIESWLVGLRSMVLAAVILTLAWSLGEVCTQVDTAGVLIDLVSGALRAEWLPALVFVVAAAVAFATGTSWGTMTVLFPLVLPLAAAAAAPLAAGGAVAAHPVFLGALGAVLAGALFGDHCSPISDTTVMSSMASACDHLDHVRTQMPYALACAGVALIAGFVPIGFGWYETLGLEGGWAGLVVGFALLAGLLFLLGRRADAPDHQGQGTRGKGQGAEEGGKGEGARGKGQGEASGFGLRALDRNGDAPLDDLGASPAEPSSTPLGSPGGSPSHPTLKPEAWSLKPESNPPSPPPAPAVRRTVDTVLFRRGARGWELLLIERAHAPFAGCWAFPGGFQDEGETPEHAARRELAEETGLADVAALTFVGVFDAPGRDPRGPTASTVYSAVYRGSGVAAGADDARRAAWHPLDQVPALAFDHADILAAARAALGHEGLS